MNASSLPALPTREQLIHLLYEAAELEHNLMCTYLYAAFSLKRGEAEGLLPDEATAVAAWRRVILRVAVEEMGHLTAVWNITAALGGAPRFGRGNFPLDPGVLPAGIVVKLAPFGAASLQHFVHLERSADSAEPEGEGFESPFAFVRGLDAPRLTPMALDYETVGAFYGSLDQQLDAFVAHHGERAAFIGDPVLQLSSHEVTLHGAHPVRCLATARRALSAIVEQGEGAPQHTRDSHFERFREVREELLRLSAKNPAFRPSFPAATNPVLRRPLEPKGRVFIEHEEASRTVDLANATYALMLRLLAATYTLPSPSAEKTLLVDLGLGLMRAMTHLGDRAARLPAGPSHPDCNAGMSFTALRDAAALSDGPSRRAFVGERLAELGRAAAALDGSAGEIERVRRILSDLSGRAERDFAALRESAPRPGAALPVSGTALDPVPTPATEVVDGIERVQGRALTILFDGKKCIHARHCVTQAPGVFLANVEGPWIHPDAMDSEGLVAVAHACPSGAIRYQRHDGRPDETPPPVNLLAVREAGPYAVRADVRLEGRAGMLRATLCRCGASKRKPFCDGSHKEAGFDATGEPASGATDMLPQRAGPLAIDLESDGPLLVRGNLEIVSGTGRVVSRVTHARLCRCGGSASKPFCDGTHARIGFRS